MPKINTTRNTRFWALASNLLIIPSRAISLGNGTFYFWHARRQNMIYGLRSSIPQQASCGILIIGIDWWPSPNTGHPTSWSQPSQWFHGSHGSTPQKIPRAVRPRGFTSDSGSGRRFRKASGALRQMAALFEISHSDPFLTLDLHDPTKSQHSQFFYLFDRTSTKSQDPP